MVHWAQAMGQARELPSAFVGHTGVFLIIGMILWICKWHLEFGLHFWRDMLLPLKKNNLKKSWSLVLTAGVVGVRQEQPCSQPQFCCQGHKHCLSLQLLIPNGPIPPTTILLGYIFPSPYWFSYWQKTGLEAVILIWPTCIFQQGSACQENVTRL